MGAQMINTLPIVGEEAVIDIVAESFLVIAEKDESYLSRVGASMREENPRIIPEIHKLTDKYDSEAVFVTACMVYRLLQRQAEIDAVKEQPQTNDYDPHIEVKKDDSVD